MSSHRYEVSDYDYDLDFDPEETSERILRPIKQTRGKVRGYTANATRRTSRPPQKSKILYVARRLLTPEDQKIVRDVVAEVLGGKAVRGAQIKNNLGVSLLSLATTKGVFNRCFDQGDKRRALTSYNQAAHGYALRTNKRAPEVPVEFGGFDTFGTSVVGTRLVNAGAEQIADEAHGLARALTAADAARCAVQIGPPDPHISVLVAPSKSVAESFAMDLNAANAAQLITERMIEVHGSGYVPQLGPISAKPE